MGGGEGLHPGPPIGAEAEAHDAVIVGIGHTFEQPCRLGPVDELAGAVVAQQEVLGDVTDRGWLAVAPHRQQQLVLGSGQPDRPRLIVAPMREPAQTVPKCEQAGEVAVAEQKRWARHLVSRYHRLTMVLPTSPRRLVLLTSLGAVLGFVGGAAAWVLIHLIAIITNAALFHELSTKINTLADYEPGWSLFVVAIAGGLLISLLAKWAPLIRGHGIPETMEAVLTKQSRVTPQTAIAKPISAAIAIGTGAPFGAEGPIIVTGGSVGSLIGQVIPVTPSERKILLAAGAAAGMSATFGAPLAAVVLAIELLLFEYSVRALIPLVAASAIAGGMHSAFFGAGPLFSVPVHDYAGLGALPAFVLLGLACGVLAIAINRGLFFVEDMYRRLPVGDFWHPAIGAIGFATVGLFVPRALGVGYDAIEDVLNSRLAVGAVAALALGKLIAWWLALGSGTSGGTLAPILLISASFGTVVGSGLNEILPGTDLALGAFAIVAMAATFGAAAQASFTAIIFVFELTQDYNVILPLMLATVVADLVYSAVNEDSLMTEKLRRRGLRIGRHYGADPFAAAPVTDIMSAVVDTFPTDATIGDARRRFAAGGHTAYPIVEDGRVVGIVSRGDVLRDDSADDDLLLDLAAQEVMSVSDSETAQTALQIMVDERVEHVPVVDDDGRLVGICTRTDLLKVRRRQLKLEELQAGVGYGRRIRRGSSDPS